MQGIVRMLLVATVDQYFIFDGARELDRKRYLVLNKSATSRVMYCMHIIPQHYWKSNVLHVTCSR